MIARGRQSVFAALALVGVVLLLGGVWLGGHPEDLPGFARRAFVASHNTRVVNEALQRMAQDYYRPLSESKLANASIAGAVGSLGDRFSHYLTPSEVHSFGQPASFTGIGVEVAPSPRGLRLTHVFDSSPAARAGLHTDDLIVAVNGRSLAGLSETAAAALVKGPPDTNVTLRVSQNLGGHTAIRTVRLTRATISEPVVASATRLAHGVKLGVVALATFSAGAHGEVLAAVESELHSAHARGIVLDLRGNGGGLVEEARLVASIFLPRGAVVVSTRGRTQPTQTLRAAGGAIPSAVPVVVLVDHNTASASEIVTAALQDHRRATVVGTHTFGKGVFQEEQPLSNGGALDITVGEYFTPDGRNLGGGGVREGAGITPEVLVPSGIDSPAGLSVALSTLAAKVR
ncbi:MAG TPA: S41 family peptidase [Solirubrobacteraceae bacterium]|jgi:carboxyl-terminal processing protease